MRDVRYEKEAESEDVKADNLFIKAKTLSCALEIACGLDITFLTALDCMATLIGREE